jgi:hypothetical protein
MTSKRRAAPKRARKAAHRRDGAAPQQDDAEEVHPFKTKMGKDGRHTHWETADATAESLGITTRWLQKLENKGMPAEGFRGSCRYPWPHAGVWYVAYQKALDRYKSVDHIDIEDAFKEYHIALAVMDVEYEFRLCADPALRDELIAYVDAPDEESPRESRLRYFADLARGRKPRKARR